MKHLLLFLLMPIQLFGAGVDLSFYKLSAQDFSTPTQVDNLICRYGHGCHKDLAANALIHEAAVHGATSAVGQLLDRGSCIETTCHDSHMTALHHAIYGGDHVETVQLLLHRGSNKNAKAHVTFKTPVWFAACYNRPHCLAALLAAGADPNRDAELNIIFEPPLHEATAGEHTDIVRLLIAHTACDINAQGGCEKRTALHLAVLTNNLAIAKMLLTQHAYTATTDAYLKTARDYATTESMRLLFEQYDQTGGNENEGITYITTV